MNLQRRPWWKFYFPTSTFLQSKVILFIIEAKAIYIRLADMVYPDGNTIKASAGLCHYANYERLCD